MNKKFLSAILFGALMVSSTGTFVSCKDYDDDIDQINATLSDLKSQIAALESKVEAGNFVTGVAKTADGKGMIFTFSNGQTQEVKLDVKDGEAGKPGEPGKDAQQVTVDEKTGELKIDGKGTGIFPAKDAAKAPVKIGEDGFWYALDEKGEYKNTNIPVSGITVTGSDLAGYTLTVIDANGKTQVVKLPTAASTLASVEVVSSTDAYFTSLGTQNTYTGGIKWGVAPKAVDWKGPKGAIAKDQLLIGQITTQNVKVVPATYALDKQTLTFVASDGSVAPVTVTATKASDNAMIAPRTAATIGEWVLAVTLNSTVNSDNIATAFTGKDENKKDANLKYALAVNSNIVTGYEFVIDTQTEAQSKDNQPHNALRKCLKYKGIACTGTTELAVGENTFTYENALAYDSYLSFEGTYIAMANVLGVKVDGMKVTVPASAGGKKGLKITVNVVDVTGTIAKTFEETLNFGSSEIESVDKIAETTYKVMPTGRKNIVISLGDVLASMSDEDAEKVKKAKDISVSLSATDADKFLLANSSISANVEYGKTIENDAVKDAFKADKDDVRDLKYITLATTSINQYAEAGKYTLVLTLKDEAKNEIKKVEMPVAITLPAFSELFEKSAAWEGDVVTMNINNTGMADFTTAYKFDMVILNNLNVKIDEIENTVVANYADNGQISIVEANIKDGATRDVQAEAELTIGGKLVVKSGKFTVHFVAPLTGSTVTYYNKGVAGAFETKSANATIDVFVAATGQVKNQGLALLLKDKAYALNATDVNGVDLTLDAEIECKLDAKAGASATATYSNGTVEIKNLAAGNYTTTLTITIKNGLNKKIETVVTLPVKVNN